MKVAILGGYGPRQSIGAVHRAFERAGHDVVHWATLPGFDAQVPRERVDLLFTFKIGLDHVPRGWIAALDAPAKVFWSFDDPYWILQADDPWIAREHDVVLTSCQQSVGTYAAKGCPCAHFMPPAMDLEYYHDWKETHGIEASPDVLVSLIATNLYPRATFPHTFVDRGEMVDRLTAKFGNRFGLYGYTPVIERKAAFRGVLHWEDSLPRAIEGTQMNLNSHACNQGRLYFNERFFQIASTRRAMFVDRMPGYVELFGEYPYILYSSLDELMDKLLHYRERRDELARIGQHGYDRLAGWTYDAFVAQVLRAIDGLPTRPAFLR